MNKSLLQYFQESAGAEQLLAQRVVKTLAFNGITDIDKLMAKTPNELYEIKGIGDKAMKLIGVVMTKEKYEREHKQDIYKKHCHDCVPTTLKDWFKKAGTTYLEACCIEKALKLAGFKTVDDVMALKKPDMQQIKGIGEKRMETIWKTQKLIKAGKKKAASK